MLTALAQVTNTPLRFVLLLRLEQLKVASGVFVDSAQGVVYVVKASMFDAANKSGD